LDEFWGHALQCRTRNGTRYLQLAQVEKAADNADALRNELERVSKSENAHLKNEVMLVRTG
jgi:hypothetical protein